MSHLIARIRMPLVVTSAVLLLAVLLLPVPSWSAWTAVALFAASMLIYLRVGTPAGPAVAIAAPVPAIECTAWKAMNSPTSRVPSHGLHAWAQTYAVDLVFDPGDGSRPGFRWWPLTRPCTDYPGFGRPVVAPVGGRVERAVGVLRDHRSRCSPPALLLLVCESVREFLGPLGVLGNHVVIRQADGVFVLLAHLQRGSVCVQVGEQVARGQLVGRCGNSGNSTEPHLHLQAMDRASVWVAAARPLLVNGRELPPNGSVLRSAHDHGTRSGGSAEAAGHAGRAGNEEG